MSSTKKERDYLKETFGQTSPSKQEIFDDMKKAIQEVNRARDNVYENDPILIKEKLLNNKI